MSWLDNLDEIGMGSSDIYRGPKSGFFPQKPVVTTDPSERYLAKYADILYEFNSAVSRVEDGAPQSVIITTGKEIMKRFTLKYGPIVVATVLTNAFERLGPAYDWAKDKWHNLSNKDTDNPNETDPAASKKQHSNKEIEEIRNQARIDDANLDHRAIKRQKPMWDLEYGYYGVKDMGKGRIIIPNTLDINKIYLYECKNDATVQDSDWENTFGQLVLKHMTINLSISTDEYATGSYGFHYIFFCTLIEAGHAPTLTVTDDSTCVKPEAHVIDLNSWQRRSVGFVDQPGTGYVYNFAPIDYRFDKDMNLPMHKGDFLRFSTKSSTAALVHDVIMTVKMFFHSVF